MERIHVDVPEQPPVGSVVLDSKGDAWQRRDRPAVGGWYVAAPARNTVTDGITWPTLLINLGPLDVVHRAEAT